VYENPKHFEEGVFVGFADGHVEFELMLAEQLEARDQSP
jgi:hypothetical protein